MTNKTVTTPIIAASLVVVVLIAGWLTWRNSQPGSASQTVITAQQQIEAQRLQALADKSHGDVNQLSPAEVDEANRITKGSAGMALSALYTNAHK